MTPEEIQAEIDLADRQRFFLDDTQWTGLMNILDQPVTDKPRLRMLLTQPSVLETDDH
jgi:uncharacterized protein (DUF1778 family)